MCAVVGPADPARLIVCHRDLHPENVHVNPAGALVVVDLDELGPAEPRHRQWAEREIDELLRIMPTRAN